MILFGTFLLIDIVITGAILFSQSTATLSDLSVAIEESSLSDQDKLFYSHLIQNQSAWDSGLLDNCLYQGSVKRIVWRSSFQTAGETHHIFLLNAFVKPPYAKPPVPTYCVITDEKDQLQA